MIMTIKVFLCLFCSNRPGYLKFLLQVIPVVAGKGSKCLMLFWKESFNRCHVESCTLDFLIAIRRFTLSFL